MIFVRDEKANPDFRPSRLKLQILFAAAFRKNKKSVPQKPQLAVLSF
jgi:hypothetical protein